MSSLSRADVDVNANGIARAAGGARVDLVLVAEMVERGAKVLDVGCGDGELLRLLSETRDVDGRGIELSREGVNECVAKGLAVIQGDADTDLGNYPDDAFDYVILSQTLQATRQPRVVLEHMLRIGRHAVVSFPNFGHWSHRLQVLRGRMPVSDNLPYQWFDTPNVHLCTVADFDAFLEERRLVVLDRVVLAGGREVNALPNLRGELAIYRFRRHDAPRTSVPRRG